MLNENIFNNIERANNLNLRYLLYLSRNNKWVKVGDDVYKIKIEHIVKDVQRLKDGKIQSTYEYESVSTSDEVDKEFKLKLNLSQAAYAAHASEGGSIDYFGENEDLYSKLNINYKLYNFERLNISYHIHDKKYPNLLDSQGVTICLIAENFDANFTSKVDDTKNSNARNELIYYYQEQKKSAHQEASKNAIWSAASTGDYVLLEALLDALDDIDLNSVFDGESILSAMMDNDPEINPPFKCIKYPEEPKVDYGATLELLITHGLDKEMIKKFYHHNSSPNKDSSLFQKNIHDPNGLLPLLKSYFAIEQDNDSKAQVANQNI